MDKKIAILLLFAFILINHTISSKPSSKDETKLNILKRDFEEKIKLLEKRAKKDDDDDDKDNDHDHDHEHDDDDEDDKSKKSEKNKKKSESKEVKEKSKQSTVKSMVTNKPDGNNKVKESKSEVENQVGLSNQTKPADDDDDKICFNVTADLMDSFIEKIKLEFGKVKGNKTLAVYLMVSNSIDKKINLALDNPSLNVEDAFSNKILFIVRDSSQLINLSNSSSHHHHHHHYEAANLTEAELDQHHHHHHELEHPDAANLTEAELDEHHHHHIEGPEHNNSSQIIIHQHHNLTMNETDLHHKYHHHHSEDNKLNQTELVSNNNLDEHHHHHEDNH